MSTSEYVERDERTVAVENASYRWAYNSEVLLFDVAVEDVIENGRAFGLHRCERRMSVQERQRRASSAGNTEREG